MFKRAEVKKKGYVHVLKSNSNRKSIFLIELSLAIMQFQVECSIQFFLHRNVEVAMT